jgi:hypothetical protein
MRLNRFGLGREPRQARFASLDALIESPAGTRGLVPSIAYRHDRGNGVALLFRGLDLSEVFLVPRFTAVTGPNLSAEALITTSAAQFVSPYTSVGIEWDHQAGGGFARNFAVESGVKFRVTVPGKWRILTLGYQFAGLRLGVRTNGFNALTNLRFIVEVGAGVW